MSDNTVLEGLALRRAVAEALGYEVVEYDTLGVLARVDGKWQPAPHVDTDLNTIRAVELPPGVSLRLEIFTTGKASAVILSDNHDHARIEEQYWTRSMHAEPATAAWNAVLRWLAARKPEAESVK